MVNLDADLRNADWTKQTWDLIDVTTEEELVRYLRGKGMSLEAFKRLPAYKAAPWLKGQTEDREPFLG